MCPIPGLVQFLIVIVALLLICHVVISNALQITFTTNDGNITRLFIGERFHLNYSISGVKEDVETLICYSEDPNIAYIQNKVIYLRNESLPLGGALDLNGQFLGQTHIICRTTDGQPYTHQQQFKSIVQVLRKPRLIDRIFTGSVIVLVTIIYINFGCALNWSQLGSSFRRPPLGPAIGLCGQFVLMPLLSFGLGQVLFPHNAAMQLGLFFTGVSPAGGASNIWTVLLDGNLELSITMTTISTLAAFALMPFWLLTLGQRIFNAGKLAVPYGRISSYAICLIVPLALGYLLSKYCKRISNTMSRYLKHFSGLLIIFIVVFATVTNLYLFQLFSWQIILAGSCLPYLGYGMAYVVAKLLGQSERDSLTIAIETGIQNTGIAIFLLRLTLPPLEADLTTAVPVFVAIMTPFPLVIAFMYKRIKKRWSASEKVVEMNRDLLVDGNGNCKKPDDASVSINETLSKS